MQQDIEGGERRRRSLLALLPAMLVAVHALWCGTFTGGATSTGAGVAAGSVLLVLVLVSGELPVLDPLRLGRGARLLPWAIVVATLVSLLASPVRRAGVMATLLLPALLFLPSAVQCCWRDAPARRSGRRSMTLVTGTVAAWSLVTAWPLGESRAALPLGHHNALAVWMLLVLPFATAGLSERGSWRWLSAACSLLAVGAVLASRSLVAAGALLVQCAVLLGLGRWRRRGGRSKAALAWGWTAVTLLALLVVLAQGSRWTGLLQGEDPSLGARRAYFEAGLEGLSQRPLLGWGPSSVAWTVGQHLPPAPGRNPPGEVVSYLHLLPLDLAYQLGLSGTLLTALTTVLLLVRLAQRRGPRSDPTLALVANAALGPGVAAICLAGFPLVGALPVAAAVAAGAGLASQAPPNRIPRRRWLDRTVFALYLLAAVVASAPLLLAQRRYEEARRSPDPLPALERAVSHDPDFPLYRARLGWALAGKQPGSEEGAVAALMGAEAAPGVAALWLSAGLLARDAGLGWTDAALVRACELDPLGAFAPFALMTVNPGAASAPVYGARAVLAEPRLAAATFWEGHETLYGQSLEVLQRWPGIDGDWQRRLRLDLASLPPPRGRRVRRFTLRVDGDPSSSLSLFAFRRLPWSASIGGIELDVGRLRRIRHGSAALRPDTQPHAFSRASCRGHVPERRER